MTSLPKKARIGKKATCVKCMHEWIYTGRLHAFCCPSCLYKSPNHKLDTEVTGI